MFTKIVCAYDGSDHAQNALKYACALAAAFGGEVHLSHTPQIVTPTIVVGGFVSQLDAPISEAEIEKAGESVVHQAAAIAKDKGVELASTTVARGDPAENVVALAKSSDADLIVMGRRGLGALGALALGSVSLRVSHGAPCACLTVV